MAPKIKHTAFYELLGTTPDVTPEQLKKAYRRTALKLHPDRGGDPEAFKTMKAAYDVLNDPKKRQMYDKYGPEVVRVMDGDVGSPEAMMAALGQISKRERLIIVLVFAVVSMFVLLFPILLSLWWDGDLPKNSSWTIGVPVWIIHFGLIVSFFSFFKSPAVEVDADAESRAMLREEGFALNKLRFWFMFNTILLLVFEVLFVMQLHNRDVGDWFVVIAPLLVFEAFNLLWTAAATPAQWLDMFHVGQTTTPGMYRSLSLWKMIFANIKWHVLRIITVCLAAWQANEGASHSLSWFVVITPLLAGIGVSCLASVCAPLPPPSHSHNEEEEHTPSRAGRFCGWMCTTGPMLIMLTVAAAKLDGGSFSAFMIWIPLFVLVFCVCCCCSMSIILITPEAMQEAARAAEEAEVDMEQGGSERTPMAGDAQSVPMYGSDGHAADDVEVIFVSSGDETAAQATTRTISAQDEEDMHKGTMVLE